jgi:hypothetical protein
MKENEAIKASLAHVFYNISLKRKERKKKFNFPHSSTLLFLNLSIFGRMKRVFMQAKLHHLEIFLFVRFLIKTTDKNFSRKKL